MAAQEKEHPGHGIEFLLSFSSKRCTFLYAELTFIRIFKINLTFDHCYGKNEEQSKIRVSITKRY